MTPSQLSNFLKFAIKNREAVTIIGPPGVGKSMIVEQACESAGAEMILLHAVTSDPTDLKGLPFPGVDRKSAEFLPYGDLKKLIDAKKPTVMFLDDFGQAPASVQAACFPAGAQVMTPSGVRNIEDIQIGEYVLDGNGVANKVTNTFERETISGLTTINAVGILPITSTSNHPVLVSSGRKRKYKKNGKGKYEVSSLNFGVPEWREASKIKVGDWIAVPVVKGTDNTKELVIERKGQTVRTVALTPDLAKLIGYYVGDGWFTQHKNVQAVGFALDEKWPELHDELICLIKAVFDCRVFNTKKESNTRRIQFHDPAFGMFLSSVAGNRSHNKRIPDFILYHKDIRILTAFLQGYLATDGSRLYSSKKWRGVQWGTVSRTLANQLQLAITRYGTLAPIKLHAKDGQVMINPRNSKAYKVRASYTIQCSDKRLLDALDERYDSKRSVCWSFEHDGKIWTRVKSVNNTPFNGNVYNLEVDKSHTYTVNNVVVHNCMQLVLARRINGHMVSEYVTFVAATNRREDKAHVQGLLEPVKSRFTLINLEVKNDDWLHWADRNGMPAELTSFIRWRPELLFKYAPSKDMTQTPCPRTVAKIGRYQNNGLSQADEFEVFTGVAGAAFAQEYCAFLKLFRNLPDIEDIIARPDKAPDPKAMDTGTLYALTGALGARMDEKSFANIMKYVDRMNPEFQIATVQVGTFPEKKRHLQQTKAFIDWAVKHPDLIL